MSDEKKKDEEQPICPGCGERHPKATTEDSLKALETLLKEAKVVKLTGMTVKDPIVRDAVRWISEYPLMAIIRKDKQPVPTTDRSELEPNLDNLGIRDKVGIMVLCAITLRIMGEEQNTLEGYGVSEDISTTFATVASSTGFPLPTGKWSVMQYVEMLNRLN